jgi:hypothetical protein
MARRLIGSRLISPPPWVCGVLMDKASVAEQAAGGFRARAENGRSAEKGVWGRLGKSLGFP